MNFCAADKLKEHYTRLQMEGTMKWNEYGAKYPAYRKAAVFAVAAFIVLVLFWSYSSGGAADLVEGSSSQVKAGVKRGVEWIIPAM